MKVASLVSTVFTNKFNTLLLIIVIFGFFLRFWHLSSMPPGLYVDEASIGFNAKSIVLTGKGEYGNVFPFWFKAFGEYKLPVYIYSVAATMVVVGINDFSIRFPSALAGSLSTIVLYFLTKLIFKNLGYRQNSTKLSLVAAFLWAISAWSLQFSRAGFEANLALFIFLLAVYLFIQRLVHGNPSIIWSLLLSGIAMATYNSARVYVPLLMVLICVVFWKYLWKQRQTLTRGLAWSLILLAPLMYYLVQAQGLVRVSQTSVLHLRTPVESASTFITNYADHFDTTYLFFYGDQMGRHSIRKQGMLYYFQLPLVLMGMVYLMQGKTSHKLKIFIFGWLLLAPIPAALTQPTPHALRSIQALPVWIWISAIGFVWLLDIIRSSKIKVFSIIGYGIIGLVVTYNLTIYLSDYYTRYRRTTGLDWSDGIREALQVTEEKYDRVDRIYISDQVFLPYLGVYTDVPLDIFHQLSNHNQAAFPIVGKYTYAADSSQPITTSEHRLYVMPTWQVTTEDVGAQVIRIENGDALFAIWEKDADS